MADLLASESSQAYAIIDGTRKKQSTAWSNWKLFCEEIGLGSDLFLDSINQPHHRTLILLAYAHAVHSLRFSKRKLDGHLQCGSVQDAVSAVSTTFRLHGRPNPSLDEDGRPSFLLQRQWRAYRNVDSNVKHQKALTTPVLLKLYELAVSELDFAVADLVIGAFFFGMRSCEYSTVKTKQTRTKRLCLRNIRFFKGRRQLFIDDDLSLADTVSITFEFQKKDLRNETVTMDANDEHAILCPVKAWARVVRRVAAMPGTTTDTPVNTFFSESLKEITSELVLARLRAIVDIIGKDVLGYESADIGTHSLRSGCAMALHLAGVQVYMIMLIGRWSSDAFLRYIRRQVREFSAGVSKRMVQPFAFFTIPDNFAHTLMPTSTLKSTF